jgi:hypothetical protein
LPTRLSKIDELTRPDHTFIEPEDECYYLGDYYAGRGFAFSSINNLINNLRKPMARRGRPDDWRHKQSAILTCGKMLRESLNEEWLNEATLIPMPSSKTKDDAEYDDRVPQILKEVAKGRQVDIRELVVMKRSVQQSHLAQERVSLPELIESMSVDEGGAQPAPHSIGIFDDVLTTGRHFKAVQTILRRRFPDVPIVGVFVVRRVPDAISR